MGRRQDTVAVLAGQYAARFRETLRPLRMIGREAEFPLVYPDGRAGDVFRLWEPLLAKGGFHIVAELAAEIERQNAQQAAIEAVGERLVRNRHISPLRWLERLQQSLTARSREQFFHPYGFDHGRCGASRPM